MAKRGRPTNTNRMIKNLSQKTNVATFGSEPLVIPNHSGDHSKGQVIDTPINDYDIANKKYVDDNAGGGGSPGGSDTQIQFNSSGSFAGDSNLIWDNTNKELQIGGAAIIKKTLPYGADYPTASYGVGSNPYDNGYNILKVGSSYYHWFNTVAGGEYTYYIDNAQKMTISNMGVTFNGGASMGGYALTNGMDGTTQFDYVTKGYIDAQHAVGEIYNLSNTYVTPQIPATITTNTYYQTTWQNDGVSQGVIASAATGYVWGESSGVYNINISMSITGTANNVIEFKGVKHNDNAGTYTDLPNIHQEVKINSNGDITNVSISGVADLTNEDRIQLWYQNKTAANKITIKHGSFALIKAR